MLEELKKEVYEANMKLKKEKLIIFTWGNVSGISSDRKYMVIKPSGVDYDLLSPDKMVVCDMDGNVIEGNLKPSSDYKTHLEIYKASKDVKGVCHTHSKWATIWAQSKRNIPNYGTTHSDYFEGDILCSRDMTAFEINNDYEKNTGKVIVETIGKRDYLNNKAVLVSSHGPFTWGVSAKDSVDTAIVLEEYANMAKFTEDLNSNIKEINEELKNKHFYRKHGKNAYYGQN